MRAVLEFDLSDEDDREAHKRAVNAGAMYSVLWEFLHNYGRHQDYTEMEENLLAAIKESLIDDLADLGIAIF